MVELTAAHWAVSMVELWVQCSTDLLVCSRAVSTVDTQAVHWVARTDVSKVGSSVEYLAAK